MPVISQLAVSGYRSLRDIKLLLAPLTIITGANGTGKSSVYRALRLLGQDDRVFHDAKVPKAILERARADAERIEGEPSVPLPDGLSLHLRRR